MTVSCIVCAYNPRREYLRRVLAALDEQTLPKSEWDLVLVDNASSERLDDTYDLSSHPAGRHVREDSLGLTRARLRGINETRGDLVVFVDDDNLLPPEFLAQAVEVHRQNPHLGVFGAGSIQPEFEVEPPRELAGREHMLALRNVLRTCWSNNPRDSESIPWGAGLCVTRKVADSYGQLIENLGADVTSVLGRHGQALYCGEDDAFSWIASSLGSGFGVFPELRVTHLIPATRLHERYLLRFAHDHAMSHAVVRYRLTGGMPRRTDWMRRARVLLHGLANGKFSMQCQWAASLGEESAAEFVREARLQPVRLLGNLVDVAQVLRAHEAKEPA